jgi:hypothetical protein
MVTTQTHCVLALMAFARASFSVAILISAAKGVFSVLLCWSVVSVVCVLCVEGVGRAHWRARNDTAFDHTMPDFPAAASTHLAHPRTVGAKAQQAESCSWLNRLAGATVGSNKKIANALKHVIYTCGREKGDTCADGRCF